MVENNLQLGLFIRIEKNASPRPYSLINDTDTSVCNDIGLNPLVCFRRRNGLAREVREEACRGARECARAAKPVHLADPAKIRSARRIGRCAGRGEVLACGVAVQDDRDILEDASLHKNVSPCANLKGMAVRCIIIPVVVDCMQKCVPFDFR